MQFHPSYCLPGASPLPLDVRYLFLVGSNIQLMVVQQPVVVLEFSKEKMSACPSTLPFSRLGSSRCRSGDQEHRRGGVTVFPLGLS